MNQAYTQAEIEALKRLYPGGGACAVRAELPHRSILSIRGRAARHGIRSRTAGLQRFASTRIAAWVEILMNDRDAAAERLKILPDTVKRAITSDERYRARDPVGWEVARRAAQDAIILKHLREICA